MGGRDDLRHGGHPGGRAAEDARGADLRRRLELRAGEVKIDPLAQRDGELPRLAAGELPVGGVVGVGHVAEAGPELREVFPAQRRRVIELDVVGDQHEIADTEAAVDAAAGVGDQQGRNAQQPRHPHRIGRLLGGIALIAMEPALHGQYLRAAKPAADKAAPVVGRGGDGKMRQLAVGHGDGVLQLVGEIPQPGAEDEQRLGPARADARLQRLGALEIIFIGEHSVPPLLT